MEGEEGGYGRVCLRACAVASTSKPAKTVAKWLGFLSLCNDIRIPGRAAPAEQPQTELNTNRTVPSCLTALSTAAGVVRSVEAGFSELRLHRHYECFGIHNINLLKLILKSLQM